MSEIRLIYVTTSDQAEAERIGHALVQERLVACANILGTIRSIYRWKGQLESGTEVAMLFKTTQARAAEAVERVRALHSYECPAIVVLPVLGGNPGFLDWVAAETTG
jgi:periplasmic divalent cation tolerance protein